MRPCATASRQPTYIPRVPSVPSTPADPSICFHCDPRVPSPFSQGAKRREYPCVSFPVPVIGLL